MVMLGLLGGCAGKIQPIGGAAGVVPVQTDAMPQPGQASADGAGQFQLRAFDKLRIEVFGVESLQRTVAVDGDGRFGRSEERRVGKECA